MIALPGADGRRFGALAVAAAYVATNLVLSLRFATARSQTFAALNAAKPWLVLLLVAGLALLVFVVLRRPRWASRALASPILTAALIGAFAVASFHLHPLLDREAVKLAGEGSDADDALIDAASRLLRGEPPYAAPTYRGNPISPGIGWVALNALWATREAFFLLTPLYLAALTAVLRVISGSWSVANLVIVAHLGCFGFWELAPTHDVAAFGLALAAGLAAAFAVRHAPWAMAALAILLGVTATARLPFAGFPVLAAVLLARVSPHALLLGIVGTAVAVAVHLGFSYASATPYQPLHLAGTATSLLPGAWLYAATAAMGAVGAWAVLRPDPTLAGLMVRAWACLVVPLGFLAVGQLAAIGFDTGRWEGANYLMPALPFIATAFALQFQETAGLAAGAPPGHPAERRGP